MGKYTKETAMNKTKYLLILALLISFGSIGAVAFTPGLPEIEQQKFPVPRIGPYRIPSHALYFKIRGR